MNKTTMEFVMYAESLKPVTSAVFQFLTEIPLEEAYKTNNKLLEIAKELKMEEIKKLLTNQKNMYSYLMKAEKEAREFAKFIEEKAEEIHQTEFLEKVEPVSQKWN